MSPSIRYSQRGYSAPSGPLLRMLLVEPVVGHEGEVRAGEAAVEIVAADAAPGRVVVGAARVEAGAGDVEETRESPSESTGRCRPGRRSYRRGAWRRTCSSVARASAWRGPSTAPARARWARPRPAPRAGADRRGPPPGSAARSPANPCLRRRLPCRRRGRPSLTTREQVIARSGSPARAVAGCRGPCRRPRRSRGCARRRSCSADGSEVVATRPSTSNWLQ